MFPQSPCLIYCSSSRDVRSGERLTRKKSKKELHENVPQHEATVTPKRKLTFEAQDSKSSEPKRANKHRVDLQKFVKNPPEPTKSREGISSPPTSTAPLRRQRSKGPDPGDNGNKEPTDPRKAKEAEEDEHWALEKYRLKHGEVATSNDEGGEDGEEWWDQDRTQEADDEETQDYVEISAATSKKKDATPSPKTVSNKKADAEGEVPQQHVDQVPKTAAPKKTTGSEGKKEAPSKATKGKTKDDKEETGKKRQKAKAKAKTKAKNSPKSKASNGNAKDAPLLELEDGNMETENEGSSDNEVGKYSASSKGPKEAKDPRDKAQDKSDAGKSKSKKPEEKKVKNGSTNKDKPKSPKKVKTGAEKEKQKDQKAKEEAEKVEEGGNGKETQVSQILRSSTAEMIEPAADDKEKEKQEKLKGYKARKARFYRSLASWDLNARGSFQLQNSAINFSVFHPKPCAIFDVKNIQKLANQLRDLAMPQPKMIAIPN